VPHCALPIGHQVDIVLYATKAARAACRTLVSFGRRHFRSQCEPVLPFAAPALVISSDFILGCRRHFHIVNREI
jgi:hypothetical protein